MAQPVSAVQHCQAGRKPRQSAQQVTLHRKHPPQATRRGAELEIRKQQQCRLIGTTL